MSENSWTTRELKVAAQLGALRLLVVSLVRENPLFRTQVGTFRTLTEDLPGQYPMPLEHELLADEIRAAWQSLIESVIAD